MLSFPLLAFALYVVTPWALYFSGWYSASLDHVWLHELMHVHLVVVGSLFFWPIVGVDPLPGRVGYPFRMLLVVLTLPFHAFLGVTIMGQETLLGGDHYLALRTDPAYAWLPDALDDQHLAGGILWAAGDLIGLALLRGAVRAVGALLDEGGRARGPAPRPARGPRRCAAAGRRSSDSIRGVAEPKNLRVLVYSDDLNTRQQVILALGRRVHPDLPELEYVEVATEPVVIQNMDAGQIDLAILDGEAVPAGGMGIAKQLKDEIYQCPPLAGPHRPPAGRLAGHVVAGRRGGAAPDRPDPAGRGRGRAAAAAGPRDHLTAQPTA